MYDLIYIKFIKRQLLFDLQIAFLALNASDRSCLTEVFSFMTSEVLFRGFPSFRKILSAMSTRISG